MNLLYNPITTHRHARWFAVIAYGVGWLLLQLCAVIKADWSVWLGYAGLIVWIIPVMWVAKRWSES